MEAVLKFQIPEEKNEFDIACHAMDWALTVWDLDQELRNKIKYNQEEFKSPAEALEWMRLRLHDLLEDRDLLLDMID